MRVTYIGACLFLLLAACAEDNGIPDRSALLPTLIAGHAAVGRAGKGGTGTGAGGFGNFNPTDGVLPITPIDPTAGAGSNNMGAAGCEAGKFCGPAGPDPDNCGSLRLEQDVEIVRVPGNLLIVFDQSLSMNDPWGTTTKVIAAQQALQAAIMSLQDSLTVGAIFFPTLSCVPGFQAAAVDPIESPNQIPFQPGPMFLNAWASHWQAGGGAFGVGTPMQEAFDRADVALSNAKLTGDIAVVAFTDGAPNCFPDAAATMIPTMTEPERAAVWLGDRKIKTYVVGLPGALGVDLLNQVAVNGGTTQYIVPDDPAMLEAKLKEVVSETVKKAGFNSCSINLTPAADPVEKLQMVVEESGKRQRVDHMLSADAGWTITPDGTHVEITGKLCEDAKAGRFESITFEYGCKDLPPLPPPPRPQ
jgi:hypothetical protein